MENAGLSNRSWALSLQANSSDVPLTARYPLLLDDDGNLLIIGIPNGDGTITLRLSYDFMVSG